MIRRTSLWVWLPAVLVAGCGDPNVDEDEGTVPLTEIPHDRTGTIPVRGGFVDGKPVELYRMGTFVPGTSGWFPSYDTFPGMPVGEMFVWINEKGELRIDQDQRPVIDSLPQQAGYSDFFELVAVTAPDDYSANDIKSRATLLRADFPLQHSGRIVNCPVSGPDAKLEKPAGKPTGEFPLVKLWYRKKTVHCLLMDGGLHLLGQGRGAPLFKIYSTPTNVGDEKEHRVAADDVYTMITNAFTGADRVTNIPVPDNDIFDRLPGDASYSPLAKIWDVTVPSDYQLGGIRSHADLFPVPDFTDPRIVERSPDAFCNCPIVSVGK
jgi:hypothetical protein